MADAYLRQLQQEGEFDSPGVITLDPEQARNRLAQYRFHHGVEGLLSVLSAYLLRGASCVRVVRQGRRFEFLSDAAPPSRAELQDLLSSMFSSAQPVALRELGLAINSLYPRHCTQLSLEVEGGLLARFEGKEWCLRESPETLSAPFRQRLSLTQHWLWSKLWRGFRAPSDESILQARTRWFPIRVEFAHRGTWASSYQLDPPTACREALALISVFSGNPALGLPAYCDPPAVVHWERSQASHSSFRAQLLPGNPQDSALRLVHQGVTVAEYPVHSPWVRFLGVVHSERLQLDLSRQYLIQDDALKEFLKEVQSWVEEGLCAYLWSLPDHPSKEVLRQLREIFVRRPGPAVLAALARFPLIRLADDSYLPWERVAASLKQFERVHVASRGPGWLHDRPLVSKHQDQKALKHVSRAKLVDCEEFVDFSGRTQEPESTPIWRQLSLEGPDWEGRAELPEDVVAENWVEFRRCGKPLWHSGDPLFPQIASCMRVYVDGEMSGNLHMVQQRLLGELRKNLSVAAYQLIEGISDTQSNPWQSCSLMLIALCPQGKLMTKELPAGWHTRLPRAIPLPFVPWFQRLGVRA